MRGEIKNDAGYHQASPGSRDAAERGGGEIAAVAGTQRHPLHALPLGHPPRSQTFKHPGHGIVFISFLFFFLFLFLCFMFIFVMFLFCFVFLVINDDVLGRRKGDGDSEDRRFWAC